MKKVLLTNFRIKEYTGSEIDTVSIANYFANHGYDVDIFTLNFGLPLIGFLSPKIHVFDYLKSSKLSKEYDLIWSHDWPLLDYIIFNKMIKSKHICYVSLSIMEPIEDLPIYYKDLSMNLVLSQKAISKFKANNFDISKIKIFPNYATQDFFDQYKKRANYNLKKICIVSNHVPKELLECSAFFRKNGYYVEIIGNEFSKKFVTPELLKDFDLIITIGKTVEYALAMGIPVYCYDHFGGDLFITSDNIKKSFSDNFSGRAIGKKLNYMQIYDDVINNYEKAVESIENNYEFAKNSLSLEFNINKILEEINNKKCIDYLKLNKYNITAQHCETFVKEVYHRSLYIDQLLDFISQKEGKINCLLNENEKLKIINKDLNINNKNLDTKLQLSFKNNNELEIKNNELNNIIIELQARISKIENSFLWKIISPLSFAYRMFSKKNIK